MLDISERTEALTNFLRHAEATCIDVTMNLDSVGFELKIGDNGRGITDEQKEGSLSLGLLGMRERAQLISGTVEIESSMGMGTTVALKIPAARLQTG